MIGVATLSPPRVPDPRRFERVYTIFQTGELQRAGCMTMPPGAEGSPPHWLVYLGTDDVDASVAKAKGLGATVYVEGTDIPTIGRFAVLADPTGAAFGLFKQTDQTAS